MPDAQQSCNMTNCGGRCGICAPTPPDFDAAVNDAIVTYASKIVLVRGHPDRELFHERFIAARQRVRELYEAVVRERDKLRAAQQGEQGTVIIAADVNTPDWIALPEGHDFGPGDKVRVCKIEEAP